MLFGAFTKADMALMNFPLIALHDAGAAASEQLRSSRTGHRPGI